MGDIALVWSPNYIGDISVGAADLLTDEGLSTAVIISLFTNRRADRGQALPLGETDRRGFWGDAVVDVPGDRIGSHLWMLAREKQLSEVIARAEEYTREALQWLIDDKVASRVEVLVENTRFQQLDIQVTIYRPSGDPAQFRYNYAWQSQAASTS
jgi:phage gp46-like protein